MADEMDWGPKRPPSVSWAGGLLLLLAVVQLGAFGLAVFLDTGALFATREHQIVTASVLALLALQVLAALGVLRLWRWWRGIAMVLSALGIALQGVNLAGQPDEPVVVGINIGLGALYAIVFLLLARSRTASA